MKFSALESERIQLVDLDEAYLKDMFEYSVDKRFYEHLEFELHQTLAETREYFNKLLQRSSQENAHYWFIRLKDDNKVIGSFGVHDIDWRKKTGEISYGLSAHYWKKGYFNEVLRVVLDYLFFTLDFHRVSAVTSSRNESSIKALLKAGFVKEGELRDYYFSYKGERYSAVILGLLKKEYKKLWISK